LLAIIRRVRKATVRAILIWLIDVKSKLLNKLTSPEIHVVFNLLIILLRDRLELGL
jgi:hypothetical protein